MRRFFPLVFVFVVLWRIPCAIGQRISPRLSGSLSLNVPLVVAYTKPYQIGGNIQQRFSAAPSATLFLRGQGLPGGWRLNTRLQMLYRYSSTGRLSRPTTVRVYQGMLSRSTSTGELRIGRFYSTYERFSDYWDGVAYRRGDIDRYMGLAIGFLPDQMVEALSFQMPRFSVFGQYETAHAPIRTGINLSYHEIRPRRTYLNHRYIGGSVWLKSTFFRLSSDLQMDQDPVDKTWKASYFYNRATLNMGWLSLTGRYALRKYYSIWRTEEVFSPRRDQYELRLEAFPESINGGFSITWNTFQHTLQGRTYFAHLGASRIWRFPVGWRLSGGYWNGTGGQSLFGFLSFQVHRLIPVLRDISLQFYRTDYLQAVTNSAALSLRSMVTLKHRIRLTSNLRIQVGDYLNQVSLYTGIWIPF